MFESRLYKDNYISLNVRYNGIEKASLFKSISEDINIANAGIKPPSRHILNGVEAVAFAVLQAAALGPDVFCYRSLHQPSFKGQAIGYKPFMKIYHGLCRLGYLEIRRGFYDSKTKQGEACRMRATEPFLARLAAAGLTPSNFRQHFATVRLVAKETPPSLRLRAAKGGSWFWPERGQIMPINPADPNVIKLSSQIDRLNTYFSRQKIDGCLFEGFYRQFNEGDHTKFAWDRGGRLYAYGNYQNIEKQKRSNIRINGESIIEIDVSGSHPTLFHAMIGAPLHPAADPYGSIDIDRDIVKSFVVVALGSGAIPRRWPKPIADKFIADHGESLPKAYPIKEVAAAVISRLPALARLANSGIGWATLQYRESLGIIGTVEALAFHHNIPALPIHDSVMVPTSAKDEAIRVMLEAFERHAGVRVRVKVKGEPGDRYYYLAAGLGSPVKIGGIPAKNYERQGIAA